MADIAIFRINYKSDFILTLNSDAGWETPFCIKFWTGAPSQAYFASYDGTNYTNCAPVDGEPTKLRVQFDDHHLPIGDMKFQIGYHFTVDDFPTSVEDEVINQASVIIEVDDAPAQVMLDLNGETAPDIEFSLPAYANESQRIENEQQRIANEEQRIANEQTRIDNEALRISAEQTRQDNEAQRIRNEQTRINQEEARVREFATLKHESEAATTSANDAAALANQKAQLAADKAQLAADKAALAQDAADLANQKAQLAADKAALADDAAALANQKAALAQQKAEYAKDQGDYAKQQGDYAKSKGDDAIAQMQQQAQAFSEAQAARQTAYEQAEGTESGSVAGDGSRWGAFKTNEAARDAKVDDKVADITNLQEAVAEGAVYDVSAKNPTAGPNNDGKWGSLSALLSDANLNTLIPSAVRRGGMSIKFVLSSDNNYVQFRYMGTSIATADFTNVANWQGVDSEPISGSNNLIDSKGTAKIVDENIKYGGEYQFMSAEYWISGGTVTNGTINDASSNTYLLRVKQVNKGDIINIHAEQSDNSNDTGIILYYSSIKPAVGTSGVQTIKSVIIGVNNPIIDIDWTVEADGWILVRSYMRSSITLSMWIKKNYKDLVTLYPYTITPSITLAKVIDADPESNTFGSVITVSSSYFGATGYIDVSDAKYIRINTRIVANAGWVRDNITGTVFYDENKNAILSISVLEGDYSGVSTGDYSTYPIPSNAAFVRCTLVKETDITLFRDYDYKSKEQIDALAETIPSESKKEVLYFTGKGNDYASSNYIRVIEPGKAYNAHILNPDFARDEVTSSSSSNLFAIFVKIDGASTNLYKRSIEDATVDEYCQFVVPDNIDTNDIYIGGRANIGVDVYVVLEEIARTEEIDNSLKNDVQLNGQNYKNGYVNSSGNVVINTSSYGYSSPIPCSKGDVITWYYVTQTANICLDFYDAKGSFLGYYTSNTAYGRTITVSYNDVAYAIASFRLDSFGKTFVAVNGIIKWAPVVVNNSVVHTLYKNKRAFEELTLDTEDFEYGSLQGGAGTGEPIYYNNHAYSRFIKVVPGSKVYFHYKTLTIEGETAEIRIRVQARKSDNFTDGNDWRLIHTGYSQVDSVTIPSGYDYISVGIGYYANDTILNKNILDIYNDGLSISSNDVIEITHNYLKELDLLSVDSNDIVMNNSPKEYQGILANMKRARKVGRSSTTSTPPPLVMLHFSDIHGDAMNVRRIVRFYNHYKNYINDVIHTGDTVFNTVADPSYLWDTDDTKWWLNVIGNHDVNGDTSENPALTAYNRFFAPYIANWNVTQPDDASDGKPYYYKDYVDNKIRLIVLNCMSYDTAQNTWFVDVLNDVLTNHSDYSVIVSQHYPMSGEQSTLLDCNFTSYRESDDRTGTGMPSQIISAIDGFIGDGGKFICHLCGHEHLDCIGYSSTSVKKQLYIVADTANCHQPGWDDGDRTMGTKMQDAFNIICFDTYAGLIKIVKVGKTWNQQLQHAFTIVLKYDETGVEIPTVSHEN